MKSLLQNLKHKFSALIGKQHRVPFQAKVSRLELPMVETSQYGLIGDQGPERFHQIQRKRRTAGSRTMQKSLPGIETSGNTGTQSFAIWAQLTACEDSINQFAVERLAEAKFSKPAFLMSHRSLTPDRLSGWTPG